MAETHNLIPELHEGRRRFLAVVADLRPELHRYCARMTGSIAEGEDIVQETLARAYYLLPEMQQLPAFRPWLFKIAHHRALDHLRRYDRRMSEPLDSIEDTAADPGADVNDALERDQAVQAAVSHFLELPPGQRACVILKDVLEHSLEEIAELLKLSLPAVKSSLHRGRGALRRLPAPATKEPVRPRVASSSVIRYAALFNARDWDGVRALLAEDVQLDLVSVAQRSGHEVGNYLSNYDQIADWHLVPAWLDGREVIAVFRQPDDERPGYFIQLTFEADKVTAIHDFRYVPYITREAALELAATG